MTVSIFPTGDALPGVSGQAGRFLSTNGTSLNWSSPIPNGTLFSGFVSSPTSMATFTNLNARDSIFLMIGNWASTPGSVNLIFNGNNTSGYNRTFAAWNGSSSGSTDTDLASNNASISSGTMFGESPIVFIKIENASSTGPKTVTAWSQASGANNLWGGIWNNSSPIFSLGVSTSNSVGYSYRMVVQ